MDANKLNDHILTKQRQEAIKKMGVQKGFPIWVIRNRYNSILGIFASRDNALRKQEELQYFMWVKLDLLFIEDIKHLSFELENL